MENFKNLPIVKKLGFNRIVLVGVLILLYFVFSLGSGRMLGQGDINNALNMVDYLGFLARASPSSSPPVASTFPSAR